MARTGRSGRADRAAQALGLGGDADAGGIDDDLRPYVELAREIKAEVERVAADDSADIDQLTDAIEAFPAAERRRVALAVFERLPVDVQWAVLERVFGDVELRDYLAAEHERARDEAGRSVAHAALLARARDARLLDTRELGPGDELTIGLFRAADVRAGIEQGSRSDSCARSLVLRCREPGLLQVIDDVFNPRGGYFVTREYDGSTWEAERFQSHDVVRIGALSDGADGPSFEPVLYLGGRADVEKGGAQSRGALHIGFVMLDGVDVFAGRR